MTDNYARRVKLAVTIGGHDATSYVQPALLDFSFTDHDSGKSDEIQLTLHDREGQWSGAWMPQRGTHVTAILTVLDWFGPGEHASLACGMFKVDELEFSGPPDKVKIKAVSASLTSGLKDSPRTKAWENISLQGIAQEISEREGLSLQYHGPAHQFDRRDQREEPDLSFIHSLSEEMGMNVKVHDGKLILFDVADADAMPAALTIHKQKQIFSPKSYSFRLKSSGTAYSDCELDYADPSTGQTHSSTVTAPAPDQKTLLLNSRAESPAQAQTMAEAALGKENRKQAEATLEIMGHPGIRAGLCIALAGFGEFGGKWFVKQCTHKVDSSGYSTNADLRRTLEDSGGSDDL